MSKNLPLTSLCFRTNTIEDTNTIAAQLLQKLKPKSIISLEGPLGAGKTHFVKALAAAMKLEDEVNSPTFTLLQSYGPPEKRLHHSDFYRLQSEAEALDLGLQDYFSEGLTVIEWGNKFPHILPQHTIRIIITPLENEVREIVCYFPNA